MMEKPNAPFERRLKELKSDRQSWEQVFRTLAEYFYPTVEHALRNPDRPDDGRRLGDKVVNSEPVQAAHITAAGIMSGLTNPSRPWFRLSTPDPDYMNFRRVAEWLSQVEKIMRFVFARSNIYNALFQVYLSDIVFGTAAMLLLEDHRSVIRARPLLPGEYWMGVDGDLRLDALYREFTLTVRQAVQKYGLERLSVRAQQAAKSDQWDAEVKFVQAIERDNPDADASRFDHRNMPSRSITFEPAHESGGLTKVSGFEEFPAMAPRWHVSGNSAWGRSPAMIALGDGKMLQKMEEKKLIAIDKAVDPPLQAPASLKQEVISGLPGTLSFNGDANGRGGKIESIFQPNLAIDHITLEGQRVERRIHRALFADFFLMVTSLNREVTAREIAERSEEKLLQIGPVLERWEHELLDPAIDRAFAICERLDLFPPPPEELDGVDLKVEYIGLLAQAQKMVATQAIESTVGFAGGLAGVFPEVRHKIDVFKMIDRYAEAQGADPSVIRSNEEARQSVEAERQAQVQAQAVEQAQKLASGAKTLADADMGGDSVLSRMAGGL